MKQLILYLFLYISSTVFSQTNFISAYGGINLNIITQSEPTNATFSERLNSNYGVEYRHFLNKKYFLNAKVGLITKRDRLTNFYKISEVLSTPIDNSPIGTYKYLHSSLAVGYRDVWGVNEEDYTYVTLGLAPNLLISAKAHYDSISPPLAKTAYEVTNARKLDLALLCQGGRNLNMGHNFNIDISFGMSFSIFPIYKSGTYEKVKRQPFHFNFNAAIALQYTL